MKKFTVKQLLLELASDKKLSEIIKEWELDEVMTQRILLELAHNSKEHFWT